MLIGDNDKENLEAALREIDRLEKENVKLTYLVNLYYEELENYKNLYIRSYITSDDISNPALSIKTKPLSTDSMFGISQLIKRGE